MSYTPPGTGPHQVVVLNDSGALPAVNGANLTGVTGVPSGVYGDGSDGAITASSGSLTTDVYATTYVVPNGITVNMNGHAIFATQSVTVNTGGVIRCAPRDAATGKLDGKPGNSRVGHGGGQSGGQGRYNSGVSGGGAGSAGADVPTSTTAGSGGAGGTGANGAGGVGGVNSGTTIVARVANEAIVGGVSLAQGASSAPTFQQLVGSPGGGGGASDTAALLPDWNALTTYEPGDKVISQNDGLPYICLTENTNDDPPSANWDPVDDEGVGGGGGAGNGVGMIAAPSIVNNGTIDFAGGNGGAGSTVGNTGGGGGGVGGCVVTIGTFTGNNPDVTGGTGGTGAGTGANGTAGAAGVWIKLTV